MLTTESILAQSRLSVAAPDRVQPSASRGPQAPGSGGFPAQLVRVLPARLRQAIAMMAEELAAEVTEVRVRRKMAVEVVSPGCHGFLTQDGKLSPRPELALVVQDEEVDRAFQLACASSVYSYEEEIKRGFLVVGGGHRVGLAGRTVLEAGRVRSVKDISGMCFRVAREIKGAADRLVPFVAGASANPHVGRTNPETARSTSAGPWASRAALPLNTLIVSPPGCGKTTVLRDLVRQTSWGRPEAGLDARRVCVVDERTEIAAVVDGCPQNDVGPRTDVLDGCPKAIGIHMAVRALSPEVVATDEIGGEADAAAVQDAVNAGVSVYATAHGSDLDDVRRRPALSWVLGKGLFHRVAFLGTTMGPGTLEAVVDARSGTTIFTGPVR